VLPISRKQTKRAEIAERYSLQAVTEVACELWQNNVVPQMIIRSPNVRPGEFAIGDAKRLLQHNRHETDMPTALRDVRSQGQSGKHLLALSFSGFDPGRVETFFDPPKTASNRA
jgi:hypothetical protein